MLNYITFLGLTGGYLGETLIETVSDKTSV